jgi:ABC-2 type transport system permease protein
MRCCRDYVFLQPINSQLIVSLNRFVMWRLTEIVFAVVMLLIGLSMSVNVTTPLSILSFVVLTLSGALILYSIWIVLIALTFWFTKFDNNVTILQAMMNAGRFPSTVYPAWLRVLVTFIIPIGVATTVPLQALRGDIGLLQSLGFVLISIVVFLLSAQVWKAGVKRYSGASA